MANPYTRLLEKCAVWATRVRGPKILPMFVMRDVMNADLSYSLKDVFERIVAADQMGFDVQLRVSDKDLFIEYVARAPEPPKEIR